MTRYTLLQDAQNRMRMVFESDDSSRFRRHILDTYFSTRVIIASLSIIFPFLLWLVGMLLLDLKLQGSISAYYHTQLRDVFVGILFAVGASLYSYKGYTTTEDFVLDGAGFLAVGIALIPTSAPAEKLACDTFTAPFWHGICAISFFAAIAYVCIFQAKGSLEKSPLSRERKQFYYGIYWILGILILALPIGAALWLTVIGETGSIVFWIEAAAILVFSFYWIIKTLEVRESGLEEMEQFCSPKSNS
ncbi:MAG: hypothetical protein AAF652_21350 [Cyanobacteria bacterium P01_C01_bin.72]